MEQIQAPSDIPHIIQVYQSAASEKNHQIIHISHPSLQTSNKVSYEQAISTDPLTIPVSEQLSGQQMQRQIVMSCQQTHLHSNISIQSQALQTSEISQPIQFTSHMILPQVPMFKQHLIIEGQQYYGYEAYTKEDPVVAKPETEVAQTTDMKELKSEQDIEESSPPVKKKPRSQFPNPNAWASNVRKLKHQRGEAYISRRGKFVPERKVRNTKNCVTSCKFRCSERINDTDRENIFKAFYSLNANEKKHFLLNTTERNIIKTHKNAHDPDSKRKYSFKYFFLVRATRYLVCKNFYLGTLAISQKPVYNVHLGKSEMNIPKPDGRGQSAMSTHALPSELKESVRKHILTFKTIDSKPIKQFSKKKQYLDSSLSIKQMYTMYAAECEKESVMPVKESMYRKIIKQEFNIHFKKVKVEQALCCKCKGPVKKK